MALQSRQTLWLAQAHGAQQFLRTAHQASLLRLAILHMSAQSWVIAPQFEPVRVILAVLLRCIGVTALGAAQLDHDSVAFFACHTRLYSFHHNQKFALPQSIAANAAEGKCGSWFLTTGERPATTGGTWWSLVTAEERALQAIRALALELCARRTNAQARAAFRPGTAGQPRSKSPRAR